MSSFDFAADLIDSLKSNGFSFMLVCTKDSLKRKGTNVVFHKSYFKNDNDMNAVLFKMDTILDPIKKQKQSKIANQNKGVKEGDESKVKKTAPKSNKNSN